MKDQRVNVPGSVRKCIPRDDLSDKQWSTDDFLSEVSCEHRYLKVVNNSIQPIHRIIPTPKGAVMAIRSTVLPWTPEMASMAQPFYSPEAPDIPGVPIGINMQTRAVVTFEPWLLKDAHIISSGRGTVLGEKDHGKSTLLKILAIRLAMVAAGRDKLRILINDHKPEGGRAEYQKLTEFFESVVYRLIDHKVNLFDQSMGITPSDSLEIALNVAEFVGRKELTGFEPFAMQLAVFKLLRLHPRNATPQMLETLLGRLDERDLDDFFETSNNELVAAVRQRQAEEDLLGQLNSYQSRNITQEVDLLLERPHNLPMHEIQRAGAYCATLLGQTRGGSYGNMFGDGEPLGDVLSQDVVTLDWTGVPDRAKSLLRTVLRIVRASSVARNDLRFIPHLSLQDEVSQSMEDKIYARWAAYDSKIARGLSEVELSGTHRLDDFRKGGVGSELYGYGESIVNDMSFTFLGRQPNDPGVLDELQQRFDLSNTHRRFLTRIDRTCFGISLGRRKVVWLKVFVTEMERELIKTDAATERILDRIPVMESPDVLRRLARLNGVEMIGAENET